MRSLLKYHLLKTLMQQFPRQNYCTYRCLYNNLCFIPERFITPAVRLNFSTLSSHHDANENNISELQEEFPEPKKILYQVLNEAFLRDQSLDIKPTVLAEQILSDSKNPNEYIWKAVVQMKWPEAFEAEGLAKRKTDAINLSFLHVCQKLKILGVLDPSNSPKLPKQKISDHEINVAKGTLLNIFQRIWHRTGNKDLVPKFSTVPCQGLYGNYWETELQLFYPENKVFKAAAFRSSNSEGVAAYEALLWLCKEGIISKKWRLLDYTRDNEQRLREYHQLPYSISLPPTLQEKMCNVLSEIEGIRAQLSNAQKIEFIDTVDKNELKEDSKLKDLITEKPYHQLTEEELFKRSKVLYEKNKFRDKRSSLLNISKAVSLLPVSQKREDILKLIKENQVVVLSGDTGCGKSTQIPQFILDYYIENMKGAECNIIVTQPRRISTSSLSDRVAAERGETVGDIVGHQIRLNRCLPQGHGSILYCTTGILLRKLLSNPNLEGISHVIIDEIHERNVQIDFILILLKNILENNKNLKLLLMSASFNTHLFAQYFNCSNIIHIPGKMYPVEEYFLEDLVKDIPNIKRVDDREPVLDVDLTIDAIDYIDKKQPPGAILCFLPGWQEIRSVHSKLLENQEQSRKLMICPIHSRLPLEDQRKIFHKPPEGVRKVILATNIAETSITIDDVVYVVDSGLHKGTHLDTELGITSLSTQWITKANVRQRKGRAGRLRPGKCYHLFSWKTLRKMEEYPVPEILRMPLENVILDCKLFCDGLKAEEFLSKGIQSPAPSAVQNGVEELQILGVLDENENLTDLGKAVLHSTAHPRLAVAIVFGAFLGCLDSALTISAILTLEKEPFINTLDDKIQIKRIKANHDNDLFSDPLALTKIYNTWISLPEEDVPQFLEQNLLDPESLLRIQQLKELFVEETAIVTLLTNENLYADNSSQHDINTPHVPSILAALTAAFFPNVIKILQGEITQGKLNKNSLVYSIIKGQKAYIQKESVVSEEENLPSPWLTYFSALRSEARRKAMISSVSSIPGICLLLFAGKEISMSNMEKSKNKGNLAILSIDDYEHLQFSCTEKEARLILDWRACLQEMFRYYLQNLRVNCAEREYVISCNRKFIPVLKELLGTPQTPFTKGQVYEFVNNELTSKELQF